MCFEAKRCQTVSPKDLTIFFFKKGLAISVISVTYSLFSGSGFSFHLIYIQTGLGVCYAHHDPRSSRW